MHTYYQKNLEKYQDNLRKNLSLIRPEIEKNFDISYKDVENETWKVFENEMLENFYYIGEARNVSNLIMGYSLIAFGVVCKRHGISLEKWGYLISIEVERIVDQVPKIVKLIARNFIKVPYFINKILSKQSAISKKNAKENPKSFISEVGEADDNYIIVYNYVQCPLYEFAKEHNYMEFMPYICNTDYISANKFGIALERFKTCSKGDEVCDFRVRKGAKPHKYWPPHILDDEDPLN